MAGNCHSTPTYKIPRIVVNGHETTYGTVTALAFDFLSDHFIGYHP